MSKNRHIQKNIRFPSTLDDQIKANGLDGRFSSLTIQMWENYLNSDEMGIDQLEADITKLRAETNTKELLLNEKRKLKEAARRHGIEEKVDELVDAWVLKHLMTELVNGKLFFKKWKVLATRENSDVAWFKLPYKSKTQINADVESGVLSPDSSIEKYAKYEFHAYNQKLKLEAREDLIRLFTKNLELEE